ncbi:MAG: ClbS/DfsB family four-helix bundle protein [Chloroflexota bacterium]|nr:ClbS/DfsB family four-helix bundle protein [Chloroflexota bacterium]
MSDELPRNKNELMERIAREWDALQRAFAGLNDMQMSTPDAGGWSVKDNLAHLAEWERFLRLHYLHDQPPHEVMGVDQATWDKVDENGLNAILFERNRNHAASEIVAALRDSHAQTLDELERLSYDDLMKPRDADDPQKRPLIGWVIGNTYEHYREHCASIEKIARQSKR